MSYKSLITHVVPDRGCQSRLRMAASVGRKLDAEVIGLGACAPWPSADVAAEGFESILRQAQDDLTSAQQAFVAHFADPSVRSAWRAEVGYPDRLAPQHARVADLVLAYPTQGDVDRLTYTTADVLVMETGLPVLMMPRKEADYCGETVLVCWKNTREARRAVSASLPLLTAARRVLVAAVCGREQLEATEAELADVAQRLARHGVTAGTLAEVDAPGKAGQRLLSIAATDRSDLIVSGAYGHSRLREWVLGGVTRDLVEAGEPYVLLSH